MTNKEVLIRDMSEDDLPVIIEAEKECFLDPWNEAQIWYELDQNEFNRCYVALIDNQIVGFAICYFLFDNAEVCQIATIKDYRNQGVGTALMNEIFNDCYKKEISFLNLEVREQNEIAHKFYLSFGFEELQRKERYYPNGDNAICMVRSMQDGHSWN